MLNSERKLVKKQQQIRASEQNKTFNANLVESEGKKLGLLDRVSNF